MIVQTPSKYHNRKTLMDHILFDSKKEAMDYLYFKSELKKGKITDLELQREWVLQPRFIDFTGKEHRAIIYKSDFSYKDLQGLIHVVDPKGMRTEVYKLKKKMFLYKYPEYIFEEI